MKPRRTGTLIALVVAIGAAPTSSILAQHAVRQATDGRPDAVIDLRTSAGAELVRGEWRYRDAYPIEVESRAPGPDLRPTGETVRAVDIAPHAGSGIFDASEWQKIAPASGEDAIDGVEVDRLGNVYVSGPGGLWTLSPAGKHFGTIVTPEHPHNLAWGGDGHSLSLTARSTLYRIRVAVSGPGVPYRGGSESWASIW